MRIMLQLYIYMWCGIHWKIHHLHNIYANKDIRIILNFLLFRERAACKDRDKNEKSLPASHVLFSNYLYASLDLHPLYCIIYDCKYSAPTQH